METLNKFTINNVDYTYDYIALANKPNLLASELQVTQNGITTTMTLIEVLNFLARQAGLTSSQWQCSSPNS